MTDPALTPEQVDHVAWLARLEIDAEERELFRRQLGAVLHYVGQLQEVDVVGVPAGPPLDPRVNAFREDEPTEPLGSEAVLANAPAAGGDMFRIPRILEDS